MKQDSNGSANYALHHSDNERDMRKKRERGDRETSGFANELLSRHIVSRFHETESEESV